MEKEFIPYKEAFALKELGFDEPCFGYYNNAEPTPYIKQDFNDELREIYRGDFEAPLYQQAFRWFREKYHIHGEPFYKGGLTKETSWYDYQIFSTIEWEEYDIQYKTYEEAELECLKKLIEIVKNKQ